MSDDKLMIGLSIFGGFLVISAFTFSFWYLASPFYYTCMQVKPDMTINEAEEIMSDYINSDRVNVTREFRMSAKTSLESPGLYLSTKTLDMRCLFSYEEDKVREIEFYYD